MDGIYIEGSKCFHPQLLGVAPLLPTPFQVSNWGLGKGPESLWKKDELGAPKVHFPREAEDRVLLPDLTRP